MRKINKDTFVIAITLVVVLIVAFASYYLNTVREDRTQVSTPKKSQ